MRKERDWSQSQAFEALREGLRFGPRSRASYRAIDMGTRPPTPSEADFLVRYFGSSPDDIHDVPEPNDPLVEAIRDLVEELRLARVAHQPNNEKSATNR